MQITATVDMREVEAMFKGISATNRAIAMQGAISDTVRATKVRAGIRIGEVLNAPRMAIRKSIKASSGNFQNLSGYVSVEKSRSLWLSEFVPTRAQGTTAKKIGKGNWKALRPVGGITVKIRHRADQGYSTTETFPHAFWGIMPTSKKLGIFQRTGRFKVPTVGKYVGKHTRKGKPIVREIIRRLRGPTPFAVFVNAKGKGGARTMLEEVANFAADKILQSAASKLDWVLRGNVPEALRERAARAVGE